MSTSNRSSKWIARLVLVLISIAYVYPLLFTIFTSLKTSDELFSNLWSFPKAFRFENYAEAFRVGRFGDHFFNSVVIAVLSLAFSTILGTFAAYALARLRVPFSGAIVGILFILMILPGESMIIPLYMIMAKLKMFDVVYMPIVVAYVGWMLPGSIVILRNFFMSIPNELLESARMDGCGELSTMFRIVFPLAGAAVATITVFNFGFAWGELMWAQISTLTTERGVPLSVGLINFQGQFTTNWPLMAAGISLTLLPLIVLFIALQKYFVQGLTAGAVKG